MTLEDLRYSAELEKYRVDQKLNIFHVGRVVSEHKDCYIVMTQSGEYDSELVGKLRYTAENRHELPAVGDWVAISDYDENKALIHSIYPRHSIIERQSVGKSSQKQLIATNIDYGLIVLAVNRDFSINRLERYLTICNDSNVEPVIVLSKIDLIGEAELKTLLTQISHRINNVPVLALSNKSKIGMDRISALIKKGKTYCLLGSSGVGKSTLLNSLTGKEKLKTAPISQRIDRGKHITSHREMIVLDKSGIIIDNPGMREVGIADATAGLEFTFDSIAVLAQRCKFKDCTHIIEKGCAILEALESGELNKDSYDNFQKLQREKSHFEATLSEKRKKDKEFGKMIKKVVKEKRQNKF